MPFPTGAEIGGAEKQEWPPQPPPRLAIYWQLDGFILDFLKNKEARWGLGSTTFFRVVGK